MKLVSYATTALPTSHLGLVKGDEVVDVDLASRALNLEAVDQMQTLIERYADVRKVLEAIAEKANGRALSEVKTFTHIGAVHDLGDVTLDAPIPRTHKNIMCLGLNYADHARESAGARGRDPSLPEYPVIFTKAPTTINRPDGQLVIDPGVSEKIDWEVELAVIIGKGGKNISEEEALEHVFGYTIINDVTARDLQDRHKQYFKGKSIDGYGPMGPWIVTADEIPDPQQLGLRLRVNGTTKQDSNTSMMIFSVRQTISILSRGLTLEPGDVIATGTPSGVGFARKPPEFLRDGDVVECEIDQIGLLRNSVVRI